MDVSPTEPLAHTASDPTERERATRFSGTGHLRSESNVNSGTCHQEPSLCHMRTTDLHIFRIIESQRGLCDKQSLRSVAHKRSLIRAFASRLAIL